MKRVGIYLRVSTFSGSRRVGRPQKTSGANWRQFQRAPDGRLSAFTRTRGSAAPRGATSGRGSINCSRMRPPAVNMIAAWSVDRLGRSLQDLVGFLTELQPLGCDLYLHQQALNTSTPSGRAMFRMCGVFAEFERGMIRERVNAGLARARAKGTKLGRRTVKPSVEERIRELKAEGMGILKIGRTLGIGTSVVQRVISALV